MYDWSVDASAGSMITGLSDLSAPGNSGRETTLTRPHWQPGEVVEVIDQTPEAVTLRLRLPERNFCPASTTTCGWPQRGEPDRYSGPTRSPRRLFPTLR